MAESFAGKTILITGGASGIGFATAKRLVAENASVVLAGRDKDRLQSAADELAAGSAVLTVAVDVGKPDDIDRIIADTRDHFGSIDGVFANAGVGLNGPPDAVSEADFDQVVQTNFKGTFFTVQKALDLFADGGSIVLNASWLVHRGMSGGSVYAASKAAVGSLAQTLAPALAPRGIRVNTVTPGHIATDMLLDMTGSEPVRDMFRGQVPTGRLGEPSEVADVVLFLLSSASSYVNGQEIVADGGMVGSVPG